VAQRALQFAGHAVAAHLGVPAGGVDEAQHQADHRRLAGSVRAEEAEDVAAADLHVEGVHGAQAAELLGERVGGQDGDAASAALLLGPRPRSFGQRLRFRDGLRHSIVHISERN